MEIRDIVANRSFSGYGLWQWDEKPGLARHAGGICLIQLVRVRSWRYKLSCHNTFDSGWVPTANGYVPLLTP
jgi:hypothetical protein